MRKLPKEHLKAAPCRRADAAPPFVRPPTCVSFPLTGSSIHAVASVMRPTQGKSARQPIARALPRARPAENGFISAMFSGAVASACEGNREGGPRRIGSHQTAETVEGHLPGMPGSGLGLML